MSSSKGLDSWIEYITHYYIAVPKKATNGEVVRLMFPDLEVMELEETVCLKRQLSETQSEIVYVHSDWWEETYKREKADEAIRKNLQGERKSSSKETEEDSKADSQTMQDV